MNAQNPAPNLWHFRLCGLASGLILALCNLYPPAVPFQVAAFGLLLYLPAKSRATTSSLLIMGLYLGLAYTIPQIVALRLPVVMTLALLLDLVAMSMVLSWLAGRLIHGPMLVGTIAVAACVTLLDWLNYTLIPLWGTAQSLARSWSEYPMLVQFESFAGMPATVFVVVLIATMTVRAIVAEALSRERVKACMAIAAMLFFVLACSAIARWQTSAGSVRVAAVGWPLTRDSIAPDNPAGFEAMIAKPVAEAAARGARLVVTPEAALATARQTKRQFFAQLSDLASANNICLVVGYIDMEADENRLVVMMPDGRIGPTYAKTHTIFLMEQWKKGDGIVPLADLSGMRLSGMICQDDNFTDLSRLAGRRDAQVVALPTLDWPNVADAHLHSSLHRTIESGYAIVRGATNGVSLIADSRGRVLARMDHNGAGAGYVIADVPLYKPRIHGSTVYSHTGNWLVPLCVLILAARVAMPRLLRRNV